VSLERHETPNTVIRCTSPSSTETCHNSGTIHQFHPSWVIRQVCHQFYLVFYYAHPHLEINKSSMRWMTVQWHCAAHITFKHTKKFWIWWNLKRI
jgi:hypothetical protein